MIDRHEESLGPIAAHGFTCTAVARIWRISLPGRSGGVALAHARPHHVEVVAPDGRHETVAIRDMSRLVTNTIKATVVTSALLAALLSRRTR